jgi:Cof subfamily protein (haloacid dehalogenase superfamily)
VTDRRAHPVATVEDLLRRQGLRPGGRADAWSSPGPAYLVTDVDGTLLDRTEEPSPAVVDAFAAAAAHGLRTGFATGRMRAAVAPLWEHIRPPGPHVLHDGALVRAEGQTIAAWPLPPEDVRATLELCSTHGWYAEVYVGDRYHVTDHREEAVVHWEMLHQAPAGLTSELDGSEEVLKATLAIFDGSAQTALSALAERGLRTSAATSPRAPGVTFINVTDPAVSKGRALRRAAAHVGLDVSAVAAVGDGPNDVPMLEVAGTAIAMGQAPPEVVAAAHLVVPEVGDDGVAHAVDALLSLATA